MNYGMDDIGRLRFYGIYEAKVISIRDPLKKNRIQVQVFQPTGEAITGWARAVLPITSESYHPDHLPHTAAQVAALLTTEAKTVTSGNGPSYPVGTHTHQVTIPALTVVAKDATKQLNHAHTTTKSMVETKGKIRALTSSTTSTTDSAEESIYKNGVTAPGTTTTAGVTTPEHTFHRLVPVEGQMVWIMFIAGDPEYPVWIGVQ
jgi:hypothetical protein